MMGLSMKVDGEKQLKRFYSLDGKLITYYEEEPLHGRYGDNFEIIQTIGKGAFGKVMLCKEKFTNNLYAMKVLRKALLTDEIDIETEIHILRLTQHPFLISLKRSFQTRQLLCFVMEFANGGDLFFHLVREGQFSEDRSRFYAAEVILALSYLHSLGIIYRDLKTENIMLDIDGHVKIVDFGLSKQTIGNGQRTSTFCGTPEYMAPEILNHERYGYSVDWWGVGMVLYEMICGTLPFYNSNYDILITLIRFKPLDFPENVSENANLLLTELLIKEPSKRLGSGPGDGTDVKNHIFFDDINWDDVESKKVPPPFKPELIGPLDTRYFDSEFIREKTSFSFPTSNGGSYKYSLDSSFINFSENEP
ncbi:hypothetical protein RI129_006057 [Pyrocoelia pectoralis]|uniref:Uncharacterized protein n=1 Tax=Pyrocoelia pectoralis TaxID=417401 RepID=A0AAN7VBU1_9COLE